MIDHEAAAFAMVNASKDMFFDAGVDRVGNMFEEVGYVSETQTMRFDAISHICKVSLVAELGSRRQRAIWEVFDQNSQLSIAYCALLDGVADSMAHAINPTTAETVDVDIFEIKEAFGKWFQGPLEKHLQEQDSKIKDSKKMLLEFIEQYKAENDMSPRETLDCIFKAYLVDEAVALKLIVYETDEDEAFVDLTAEAETTKETYSVVLTDDDYELMYTLHNDDKEEIADKNVSYDANMVGEYTRYLDLLLKQQV